MRRAAKRDKNERAIISTWEALGAYVEQVSGPGLKDTLVHHDGRIFRAEVKGAKRGLTKLQVESFKKAYNVGVVTYIIRTVDDAKDMLECARGTLLHSRLVWRPEHGTLAGAERKERAFRPGTDKARSLAESCTADFCSTSAVPGISPRRCAAHHAGETFAPEPQKSKVMAQVIPELSCERPGCGHLYIAHVHSESPVPGAPHEPCTEPSCGCSQYKGYCPQPGVR